MLRRYVWWLEYCLEKSQRENHEWPWICPYPLHRDALLFVSKRRRLIVVERRRFTVISAFYSDGCPDGAVRVPRLLSRYTAKGPDYPPRERLLPL
jgi:hypothetical protein